MKNKFFSIIAIMLFMSSTSTTIANIEAQKTIQTIDACNVEATIYALHFASAEVSYYRVWFDVYAACISEQGY